MNRHAVAALAGAVFAAACGLPAPSATPQPAGSPRWVQGPTPEVRTLLLDPVPVGAVEGAGHEPSRLELGAFFARLDRSEGPVDQLALMLEIRGVDAAELLRTSRELLLEVDGELFVGEPGVSANSFRVDRVDDEPRATVVIPVSPEVLERLSSAEVVRGRLGLWASFTVPASCRTRFGDLLRALPEGAESSLRLGWALRRATEVD